MSQRLLVVLTGFPGAGKSTLSRTVCDVLRTRTGTAAIALSTDDVIPIQCADALHADQADGLPYHPSGDRFVFEPAAREQLSMRAVAGLARLLALLGPLMPAHLVAELPSRWAPLFLDAAGRADLTARFMLLGVELVADPATCRERNRLRAQQLPSDAVRHMTRSQPDGDPVWGTEGKRALTAATSVSTEGPLDAVRGQLAERCAALLASLETERAHHD